MQSPGHGQVKHCTCRQVLPVPHFRTAAEWESYAAKLREEVLAKAHGRVVVRA